MLISIHAGKGMDSTPVVSRWLDDPPKEWAGETALHRATGDLGNSRVDTDEAKGLIHAKNHAVADAGSGLACI